MMLLLSDELAVQSSHGNCLCLVEVIRSRCFVLWRSDWLLVLQSIDPLLSLGYQHVVVQPRPALLGLVLLDSQTHEITASCLEAQGLHAHWSCLDGQREVTGKIYTLLLALLAPRLDPDPRHVGHSRLVLQELSHVLAD